MSTLETAVSEIGETVRNGQNALAEIITGGQSTFGGVVSDVAAIPATTTEAATAPAFSTATKVGLAAAGVVALDILFNGGKALKSVVG